jgi:multidrug efflux pump subunit AcrA (membrane-fusion protein)
MRTIRVASKNSFWRSKTLLFGVLFCAVMSGLLLWWVFGKDNSSDLRIAKVQRGDLFQRVTVAGTVEPNKSAPITTPYTGYVQKVYVKVGQKVKANDPIVTVTESLVSTDKAFPIRASFPGTVVQVEHIEGDYVRDGATGNEGLIVRIDDLTKLFVQAQAPEVDINKMKIGMETDIRVSAVGETNYHGIVRDMALAAKSQDSWRSRQSTFDLRIEITDPDEQLRPGMSAVVDVVTAKYPNVLYLPLEYVYQEGPQYYVFDRRGRRINVEIGHQTDMAYEITKGLKEGDEVRLVDVLGTLDDGDE